MMGMSSESQRKQQFQRRSQPPIGCRGCQPAALECPDTDAGYTAWPYLLKRVRSSFLLYMGGLRAALALLFSSLSSLFCSLPTSSNCYPKVVDDGHDLGADATLA